MAFTWKEHNFEPYRDFTSEESNRMWLYLTGKNISVDGYDHKAFYDHAKKHGAVTDIYLMDDDMFVVPVGGSFCVIKPENAPEHWLRISHIKLDSNDCMEAEKASQLLQVMSDEGKKDFYPTSPAVADLMCNYHKWPKSFRNLVFHNVLEPSAGRGDLLDAFYKRLEYTHYVNYYTQIDCIEINPDLRNILKGKGRKVIHDDFLSLREDICTFYDLILMNPPFSEQEKHLEKAMRLQRRNGGHIISLVNAEMIKNPYTRERKALIDELTQLDATVMFVEDGFVNAARRSNVEVAILMFKLPEPKVHESDIFERLTQEEQTIINNTAPEQDSLVPYDFVSRTVASYNVEIKMGLEMYRIYNELRPHILHTFDENSNTGRGMVSLSPDDPNEFIKSVRQKYWTAALHNPELVSRLTSNIQQEWHRKLDTLSTYDYTAFNVNAVMREMLSQAITGVKESILEYFDSFTRYAMYDGSSNVHYYNGWKTNKAYKVNKKIILPAYSVIRDRKDSAYMIQTYGLLDVRQAMRQLQDIEKVFNYLEDGTAGDLDLYGQLEMASKLEKTRNINCKHFSVTFFKKGTMHITFNDQKLVDAFNIYAARHKNWLPETYGYKEYDDLTEEEKAVIDDFQGKEAYERVLADKQYYLQSPEQKVLALNAASA